MGRWFLGGVHFGEMDGAAMIYILARVHSRHEFNTADAINNMTHRPDPDGDLQPIGAVAVVPREIVIERADPGANKKESITYRPLLPRLMFLACTEQQWFQFQSHRLFNQFGQVLPPIRREMDILPRSWAGLQAFAARAELECDFRLERFNAGKRVGKIRPGDVIRMIDATIADIDLAGRMGKVLRVQGGKVFVQTDVQMMGKPVVAELQPRQIGIAAE